ncbi:MAG: glucosamine--fructose-6-phosphate aminotransferase (isomerizing), partial [Parcubacteria group bacterium Gr01-1014_66]
LLSGISKNIFPLGMGLLPCEICLHRRDIYGFSQGISGNLNLSFLVLKIRTMCGIVGYIGKKNAVEVGIDGLRALQYRGYDSAGIAFLNGEKIVSARAVGKIENLEGRIDLAWNSGLGIFHTRWATHGGVTEENAHPHQDCAGEISLCHNGIIENFKEIKEALIKKGHTFRSETDSEVIPHLIEENMKSGIKILNDRIIWRWNPMTSLQSPDFWCV